MYKYNDHTNTEFEALHSELDVVNAEHMLRMGVQDGSIEADSVRLRVWNAGTHDVETILCPHLLGLDSADCN